jgi:hypothetical protein
MLRTTIAMGMAASLAGFAPQTASADIKDGIIGGVVGGAVGAIVTESIRNNNNNQRSNTQATTTTRSSNTARATSSSPSLNSQYSRGERIQIQTALNNLGYNVGTVDGVLGKRSRAGIRAFQASRGEPQTGQLTAAQYAALTNGGFGTTQAAFMPNNRPLQTNEVFLLQQSLWQMGLFQGTIDGVNGVTTQNAATSFLLGQNRNPQQTTHVQTLVLAAGAAGQMVPQYLVDEANAQMAAAQGGNLFGAPSTQGTTLATQPQSGGDLFGAPAQATTASQQNQQLFGTQQQQQAQPAPATNDLFGTVPQQETAPQQQQLDTTTGVLAAAPQSGDQNAVISTSGTLTTAQSSEGLFATTTQQQTGQQQPAAALQAEPTSSTLDIFSGSN